MQVPRADDPALSKGVPATRGEHSHGLPGPWLCCVCPAKLLNDQHHETHWYGTVRAELLGLVGLMSPA